MLSYQIQHGSERWVRKDTLMEKLTAKADEGRVREESRTALDELVREGARRMLQEGIAIRVCDNFPGLDERYFRLAVRTRKENMRLLGTLRAALDKSPGRL